MIFTDRIMRMGFQQATRAGISFGKDDLVVPDAKWSYVHVTEDKVKEYEQQYMDGLITQGEKYNKVVDAWAQCTDQVADAMMQEISKTVAGPAGELGVHDGPFRRPRFGGADEAARRHARA